MDTSKEYIKMCEKAVEITKGVYGLGNIYAVFYATGKQSGYTTGIECEHNALGVADRSHHVWLPRQDQLQEMISILHWGLTKKGKTWSTWKPTDQEFLEAYSLEKALLKRVMKEKYNKT